MKKITFFVLIVVCAMQLMAQDGSKRALFIGNSYTEVNNLPQLVKLVSESAGAVLECQSNTPGGCTFSQHCENQSMNLIRQGNWDVVVLQEQSQLPSFPQSQVEVECFPYAAQLVDSIYANNPDGEAMFYMTWGRRDGDQQNAQYFPVLGTYEGMDSMLYERYMYMARTNDASVCPVGRSWRYIRGNNPSIELYSGDGSHPSMAGSYVAACAFYTMIFHASPDNITYDAGLPDSTARYIRNVVRTVVYDSLNFWLRQTDTTPAKQVLFVGNSYTEVNDLPQLVQRVAESAGDRMEYRSNTPGGCTFAQHCSNQSMTLIRQGGWDVVVLQEQSQLPSFPQNQVEVECFPYATRLVDAIYDNNPDGEAMFYMTWGRRDGDQGNAIYFPVLGTYEGMDSLLYERYMYMARANDASVCPVGRVWRYIRGNNPSVNLYGVDGSHPSMAGSYAAACSFYTMIFHANPDRITYNAGLDDATARYIRDVVRVVVYDTLGFWLRQAADTTQTDTTQTDTTQVDTTQIGIATLVQQSPVSIYPNPVADCLSIRIVGDMGEAALFDLKGRRLRSVMLQQSVTTLAMNDLPKGVYLLTVITDSGVTTQRIVKQ